MEVVPSRPAALRAASLSWPKVSTAADASGALGSKARRCCSPTAARKARLNLRGRACCKGGGGGGGAWGRCLVGAGAEGRVHSNAAGNWRTSWWTASRNWRKIGTPSAWRVAKRWPNDTHSFSTSDANPSRVRLCPS